MDLHMLENRFEFQRPSTPRRAFVTDAVQNLVAALAAGQVEVVDLTQPLSEETLVLRLPEPFANTPRFRLRELSHYDERGPAWYWNAFEGGEHTGTHFDAPIHWVSGQELDDVSQVPPSRLIGPAVVIDHADRAAPTPTTCSGSRTWRRSRPSTAACPTAPGCCTAPAGTPGAQDEAAFLNADDTGPHTPGIDVACARWLATSAPSSASSRPSAPTPAPPTASTPSCHASSAPASTASPSWPTSAASHPPAPRSPPSRSSAAPAAPPGSWPWSPGSGRPTRRPVRTGVMTKWPPAGSARTAMRP